MPVALKVDAKKAQSIQTRAQHLLFGFKCTNPNSIIFCVCEAFGWEESKAQLFLNCSYTPSYSEWKTIEQKIKSGKYSRAMDTWTENDSFQFLRKNF